MAFDYFGTYQTDDYYEVYRPNNYSEALNYDVESFNVTSTSSSWIVNYEDISYYYSSEQIKESDDAISMFYEELVKNADSINGELPFICSFEINGSQLTIEKELLNPNNDEISYMIFSAYIPFLIKNTTKRYEHFVYTPVYRAIILVNGENVEDPFTKTMITMEAFEAKYNQ
jgi:hypothetical protein